MNKKMIDVLRKACVDFFYWWHNTPGSNTEQGFDQWLRTVKGEAAKKDVLQAALEEKSCVGCTFIKQVAELHRRSMQGWTSVKEGWPEPVRGDGWGRPVLTLYDSGVMCVESMFLYQSMRPSVPSTRYFAGECQTGVKARVTHWMELPARPDAEDETRRCGICGAEGQHDCPGGV